MMKPVTVLYAVRWLNKRASNPDRLTRRAKERAGLFLAASLFLISMLFSGCSGTSASTSTPSTQALNKIKWCGQPLMVFRDEGAFPPTPTATAQATVAATPTVTVTPSATASVTASKTPTVGPGTPQTVSDWSLVEANLGFAVYLPTTLPTGTCLVSAQATFHDAIFGGSFTIGYLLPNHTPLSVSEAPLKSQSPSFQCSDLGTTTATTNSSKSTTATSTPSPTAVPTPLCSGAKKTTYIVLSGPGTDAQLQKIFEDLQPGVNWIPAS